MRRRLNSALCRIPAAAPVAVAGIVAVAALGLGASASPVEAAFGKTILSTYPDGRTARLWLHPDGSYAAKGRRGQPSSGHWSLKGEQVCLKQAEPFAAPFTWCTGLGAARLGATWTAKAFTGEPIRVRVVDGDN